MDQVLDLGLPQMGGVTSVKLKRNPAPTRTCLDANLLPARTRLDAELAADRSELAQPSSP